MSALPKIPIRMTVAEFLAWNPPSPLLWQLVDGDPQPHPWRNTERARQPYPQSSC